MTIFAYISLLDPNFWFCKAHSVDERYRSVRCSAIILKSHLTGRNEQGKQQQRDCKHSEKSSSIIRSLPGSLGSDNNYNLMESGNFSFMRKGKQTTKYENTPMKKSVISSHSTEPADRTRFNQPPIEIIAVTQLPKSSQNLKDDITTLSSDSETDYEVLDSDYSESSDEDDDNFPVNGYV